jgi:predicted RND superfamily exporter protein
LGAAVLLSAALVPAVFDLRTGAIALRYDPSTNQLLPHDEAASAFYRQTRKLFGNDETLIVALRSDDVFRAQTLDSLRRMAERIAALPGVHHVSSLATTALPRGGGDGDELSFQPLLARAPASETERNALRLEALANPLVAGKLVSRDAKLTTLVVHFDDFSDREFFKRGFDADIERIASEEARGAEVYVTGVPHLKLAATGVTFAAVQARLPWIAAVVFAVLVLTFRTARGVLAPLVVVGLTELFTFALLGLTGRPLNAVTATLPALLAILGLVYSVHVISAFYDELREAPNRSARESMFRALRRLWLPMLLAALTTATGLLAALATPVHATRQFAWLALAGILVAFATSVIVTPAMLLGFGRPSGFARQKAPLPPDWFARFASATARFVTRRPAGVGALFAVLLAVSLFAAARVRISTDVAHAFPEGHPARSSFDAINRRLDGATSLRVVVTAESPGQLAEPANLRALADLEAWLESQPEVGSVSSVTDWLRLLHRAADPNDAGTLPEGQPLAQELLLLGRGETQNELIDPGLSHANLVVNTQSIATDEIRGLVHRTQTQLARLPAPLHGRVTGQAVVFQSLFDQLVAAQVESLMLSLGVVYVILSLFFLSPIAGLRALAPNIVPVAFYFGALGAAGVPLSLATSIVAPIALGFALNDTIHYFARFAADARRLADEEAATLRALVTVGRPMTYSTLALCAGFTVLATSNLDELVRIGVAASSTLAIAWLCDFTLTPALCVGLRVVTLWDTLSLDLGPAPQASIPLLRDLTPSQCRIVAQLGSLRSVPAGQPLLRSGVGGREMYLVIDGLVEAWIETPLGRQVLNRFSRGDLFGEVGFYTTKHSAELVVVERARLLRLTQRSFERLERRSPRISAVIYRNLSRILAGRVAETTERIR